MKKKGVEKVAISKVDKKSRATTSGTENFGILIFSICRVKYLTNSFLFFSHQFLVIIFIN